MLAWNACQAICGIQFRIAVPELEAQQPCLDLLHQLAQRRNQLADQPLLRKQEGPTAAIERKLAEPVRYADPHADGVECGACLNYTLNEPAPADFRFKVLATKEATDAGQISTISANGCRVSSTKLVMSTDQPFALSRGTPSLAIGCSLAAPSFLSQNDESDRIQPIWRAHRVSCGSRAPASGTREETGACPHAG